MTPLPGVHLFVYGTLKNADLVVELTGRCFVTTPAVLHGYRMIEPARGYPYIVRDVQARVGGLLLRDVDLDALRCLDAYENEGALYRRIRVEVVVEGRIEHAQVYVGAP